MTSVLDQAKVSALRALGTPPGAVLDDMLTAFLSEAPKALGQIDAALAAGDSCLGARLAHRVKGISGVVGATDLTAAFDALERAALEEPPAPKPHLQLLAQRAHHEGALAFVAARRIRIGP